MNPLPLLSRGAVALLALPLIALAQGSLIPPGAPAPTMRTLDQLGQQLDAVQLRAEARIAVNATNTPGDATCMFQISRPGSYYLPDNVEIDGARHGVRIAASGVTLDLNGFTISAASGGAYGVYLNGSGGGPERIAVRNGTIAGGAGGVFGDAAAQVCVTDLQVRDVAGPGVYLLGGDCLAARVQTSGTFTYGIYLAGTSTLAVDCTVSGVTNSFDSTTIGIRAAVVRGCAATNVKGTSGDVTGLSGTSVEDSTATDLGCTGPGTGKMLSGIFGTTVRGCTVYQIGTGTAIGVYGIRGDTVEGCSAATVSGKDPYGINGASGTVRGCRVFNVGAVAGSAEAHGIRGYAIQGCTVNSVECAVSAYGLRGNDISGCMVGDITALTPSGIASSGNVADCQVRSLTANSGSPSTYGISASGAVSACTVTSISSPSLATYAIYGATVRGCRLYTIASDAGSAGGFAYGIATPLAGVVEGNSLQTIRNVGIFAGQGSVVRGNAVFDVGNVTGVTDGKAILGQNGCSIEANVIGGNASDYGIFVAYNSGCLIVGNQCNGPFGGAATGAGLSDTGAYNISAGNRLGAILTGAGVIASTVSSVVNIAN